MPAVHIDDGQLFLGEHAVRPPGEGEVLVRVAAAGLNRADVLQRRGLYPAPPEAPANVPGLEFAGVVAAVGRRRDDANSWEVGARVMGIVGGGAMATEVVASAAELMPVPDCLSLEHAAAIPEAFITAFDALFMQGRLASGESVLVHAVGSGVGTAALQIARAAGHRVIGTSRTADKLVRARALGLDTSVHVESGEFAAAVVRAMSGGVDVVVDLVGAAYFDENVAVLAPRGRIVVVGLLGGQRVTLRLGPLLEKRASIIGTVLRSRPAAEKAALVARFAAEVLPRFVSGALVPIVDAVMPMARVMEAHERMERNDTFGKIVLTWDGA
jgi:putative PIG3 family NAD(P)H quinone oxidoreductase